MHRYNSGFMTLDHVRKIALLNASNAWAACCRQPDRAPKFSDYSQTSLGKGRYVEERQENILKRPFEVRLPRSQSVARL